jgi:hypothetical protein
MLKFDEVMDMQQEGSLIWQRESPSPPFPPPVSLLGLITAPLDPGGNVR